MKFMKSDLFWLFLDIEKASFMSTDVFWLMPSSQKSQYVEPNLFRNQHKSWSNIGLICKFLCVDFPPVCDVTNSNNSNIIIIKSKKLEFLFLFKCSNSIGIIGDSPLAGSAKK